jgi:hypothetical protein
MKLFLMFIALVGFSTLTFAGEKCGKVEKLFYKAYPDMPQNSGITMGISGNNGNLHSIPDSAVSLATAAKVHGLIVCYTVELDQDGRVFIGEIKLK